MKTKPSKNLDDLVFEKRNKDYGAYYLRAIYKKQLSRSICCSILAFVLAVGIPFMIFKRANTTNIKEFIIVNYVDVGAQTEELAPLPPTPPIAELERMEKFIAPTVTYDSTEVDEGFISQDDLAMATSNSIPVDVAIDNQSDAPAPTPIDIVKPQPKIIVDEPPTFPGGEELMYKFLKDKIVYPQIANETGIQGKVWVYFVIETDGTVDEVRLIRGIGGGCDEEALRVVKGMPKWNPGRQEGAFVRVEFKLPVAFVLQ